MQEKILDVLLELVSKNNKLLVKLASYFLVIVMAWSLAQAVLFYIENMDQIQFAPAQKQIQQSGTGQQRFSIESLNLFGSVEETAVTRVTEAPKTSLNLELQGVFTTDNAADATAIVANKGKVGELYRIGDRLPGNATLNAVFDDYVLIKRGSRIEKLAFFDSPISQQINISTPDAAIANNRAIVNPGQNSRLQQVRQRIAQRSQEISRNRNKSQSSSEDLRQRLASFQKRMDQDPQALLDELGVSQVSASGANGYKIGAEVSQSMLRQAGLQQGDVILSVNGSPVGNVANDKALINQAMAAKRVRVEVQRDSRRFFVTVPLPN